MPLTLRRARYRCHTYADASLYYACRHVIADADADVAAASFITAATFDTPRAADATPRHATLTPC